jgi:hypothetical protein
MNAPIVEEAGAEKKVLFGWCMDGNDGECIGKFPGHRCNCECHVSGEEIAIVAD